MLTGLWVIEQKCSSPLSCLAPEGLCGEMLENSLARKKIGCMEKCILVHMMS